MDSRCGSGLLRLNGMSKQRREREKGVFKSVNMIRAVVLACGLAAVGCTTSTGPGPGLGDGKPQVSFQNLLVSDLAGVNGKEVIVGHVTIPPHTSLPKHWHPGEEFGYVLEGSVRLWQQGKADVVGKKGDVVKVPLKQIHTGITGAEGATLLVFRVHEKGQP